MTHPPLQHEARQRFEALSNLVEAIHQTRDVNGLARILATKLPDFVEIERCALVLQLPGQESQSPAQSPLAQTGVFQTSTTITENGPLNCVAIPLTTDGRSLGTLDIGLRNTLLTQDETFVLQHIATHTAMVLGRMQMFQQVEQDQKTQASRAHRMALMADFARSMTAVHTYNDLFGSMSRDVREICGCQRVSFARLQPGRNTLKIVSLSGCQGITMGQSLALNDHFQHLLHSSEPVILSGFDRSSMPELRALADEGVTASISMGINTRGAVAGVLNLGFASIEDISQEIITTFSALTNIIAVTLYRLGVEAELRQAQKQESLGTMAGGLAHDFNNLLGAALGHLSVAEALLPPEDEVHEDLAQVRRALERSAGLTSKMLAYAGHSARKIEDINLNQTILELGQLLSASIPKHVELRYELAARGPVIKADATQLQQVIVNLLTNAAAAIPSSGGLVLLKTQSRTIKTPQPSDLLPNHTIKPGRYASFVCQDNGVGISEDHILRIFEPYFTTRPSGNGLGLSAVLGIVREHQGDVRVQSTPGQGTTFEIILPEQVPASLPTQPHRLPLALVIDDEEAMRRAAARMLKVMGYSVLVANDAIEGLNTFQKEQHQLRLVLTDQSMPGMLGTEAIVQMRQQRPELPIILMTGFDPDRASQQWQQLNLTEILHKPFGLEILRKVLAPLQEE